MITMGETEQKFRTNIKIVGVGGAGNNAIETMIENKLEGVEFVSINTDLQQLGRCSAKKKVQIGKKLTKGLGTGARPEIGKQSAEENIEDIRESIKGADMVFITAGMGGGTGTGAAPITAQIAREEGALTLAIVTYPFVNEGKRREKNADIGLKELQENVNTMIVIKNDKLTEIYGDMPLVTSFKKADEVLFQAARSVSDIINYNGYINVDFSDVKTVMSEMGYALMGSGVGEGEDKAIIATKNAINNPLLDGVKLVGSRAILINITAGYDLKTSEFETITKIISDEAGEDANIIQGVIFDENMKDKVSVTVIAAGVTADTMDFPKKELHIHEKPENQEKKEIQEAFERIRQNRVIEPYESIQEANIPFEEEIKKKYRERIEKEKYDTPSFIRRLNN
ncbi:MAG: cell division protein FtsZ [Candidatus Cloacimonadota bacterium]|nr:MAG: cell division protein FtsZ [Candidatus Cloacimonadota bacterium]